MTGFFRDGCCNTGAGDVGTHTVCAIVDDTFLEFSARMGNDLITPRPEYGFEGLKSGDHWCLCALRWEEARLAGCAPRVKISSTNIKTLKYVQLECTGALMPNGRREGLKASPLLLLGYRWTLGLVTYRSAALCKPPDEYSVSSEQFEGSDRHEG